MSVKVETFEEARDEEFNKRWNAEEPFGFDNPDTIEFIKSLTDWAFGWCMWNLGQNGGFWGRTCARLMLKLDKRQEAIERLKEALYDADCYSPEDIEEMAKVE